MASSVGVRDRARRKERGTVIFESPGSFSRNVARCHGYRPGNCSPGSDPLLSGLIPSVFVPAENLGSHPSPSLRGRCHRQVTKGGASVRIYKKLFCPAEALHYPALSASGHLPLKGGEGLVPRRRFCVQRKPTGKFFNSFSAKYRVGRIKRDSSGSNPPVQHPPFHQSQKETHGDAEQRQYGDPGKEPLQIVERSGFQDIGADAVFRA